MNGTDRKSSNDSNKQLSRQEKAKLLAARASQVTYQSTTNHTSNDDEESSLLIKKNKDDDEEKGDEVCISLMNIKSYCLPLHCVYAQSTLLGKHISYRIFINASI